MRQVTLNIPDKKYPAFMKLIKSLDYVDDIDVEGKKEKEEVLDGIKQAFKEVKLVRSGKLKAKPIKELLDEL
jgi:hypothetical protein